jgi:hypothetical protein
MRAEELIEKPSDGWLEWFRDDETMSLRCMFRSLAAFEPGFR